MLDIQKFQALPKEQQNSLQEAIKFVHEIFGKEFGSNIVKDYLLQYGVWSDEIPSTTISEQPQSVATVEPIKAVKQINNDEVYNENWIVLQNRLLHAISNLELNERRLILFLSPLVRLGSKNKTKKNREIFTVMALDFAKEYGINPKNVYKTLEVIATGVLQKAFFYWNFSENERGNRVGVSWFVMCEYKETQGCLEIVLADEVVEMLTVFDKANPFTKYQKDMIVKLGTYGIVLFELIASCMYQKHKQKTYSIEYLREKFDCVDTYPKVADFKNRVIDKAIQEIHKYTPYRISYTQQKDGRTVKGLIFNFEDTSVKVLEDEKKKDVKVERNPNKSETPKKQTNKVANVERDPNTIDWVNNATDNETKKAPSWQTKGLSDGQISKLKVFAQEFCDSNINKMSPTFIGTYSELIEVWKTSLKDPSQVTSFNKIQELLDR